MTHWRKFNKRMDPGFLYAEDIGPPGSKLDVEIINASGAKIKNPGGAKECTALDFRGHNKRLGLGATTAKEVAKLFGTAEIESWRGWITLVVINTMCRDPTTDSNDMVPTDVIRIAPTRPDPPRSQAREHPLATRFDACGTSADFDALEAEARATWDKIPKGEARASVAAAVERAKAKHKTPSNAPPPAAEQAANAAEEAKLT